MKNPIQPIFKDENGIIRFKDNLIVKYLLESHPLVKMSNLAALPFSNDDRQQFAQLIGYSVSGYGGLRYVDSDHRKLVATMAESGEILSEDKLRIEILENELKTIRDAFRGPCSELFNIASEDLED